MFELRHEHLKLLKHLSFYWSDVEKGGVSSDPKRPFGSGFYQQDIAEILGWDVSVDGLTYEQLREAEQLYRELLQAHDVVVRFGLRIAQRFLNIVKPEGACADDGEIAL